MFYLVTVKWYSEYTEKMVTDTALVFAKNFGDAAEKVVAALGCPESVDEISVKMFYDTEDGVCWTVNDEQVTALKNLLENHQRQLD